MFKLSEQNFDGITDGWRKAVVCNNGSNHFVS